VGLIFRSYLLPGLVFLAVVIGGGYSTGRELVQFFLPAGPRGGLLGMLVTACIWSAALAVTFELARLTRSYDYKSFFTQLLGRGWILFEAAYFIYLLIVLAVIGAAAGAVSAESFGLPATVGTLVMMILVGLLVFFGSGLIAKVLTLWAVLLYGLYIVVIVWSFAAFGDRIAQSFRTAPMGGGWVQAGITYAGYNLSGIPAVLFCLRSITRRREAIMAGVMAGPLAMLPGALLFVAMTSQLPQIGREAVPSNYLIGQLHEPLLRAAFQIIFFGVLVKTGAAMLHAINERIARVYETSGKSMPRALRAGIALAALALSALIAATFGLVVLVAKGYGSLTYVFIALLVIPLLTVGVWRIAVAAARGRISMAGPTDA